MDPQKTSSGIISMFPIIILFVLFYFLLIKPQQKKAKEQKDMVDKLSVGDNVVLYINDQFLFFLKNQHL